MNRKEAKELVIKYSKPYRNSIEGLLVSAAIFDMATSHDAGVLFDTVLEYAEQLIGNPIDVAPAPAGWLRIVPRQDVNELICLQ